MLKPKETPTKRRRSLWQFIGVVTIILLSLLVLSIGMRRDVRALNPIGVPIEFRGEYSWDQVTWQPLTQDTNLNALDGDLYLRGNFNSDMSGRTVQFYLDHIVFSITLNGQILYGDDFVNGMDASHIYGKNWDAWKSDDFTADDVLEIHLHNPYSVGNPRAYQELLGNMYLCGLQAFDTFMLGSIKSDIEQSREKEGIQIKAPVLHSGQSWRVIGFTVLVLAALLLGVAFADALQGTIFGARLWKVGMLAAAMSACILLDTSDVQLWSTNYTFNTYTAQLCRMLVLLILPLLVSDFLNGTAKNVSGVAIAVGGAVQVSVLLAVAIGWILLYQMITVWIVVQAVVLVVVLVCGAQGFAKEKDAKTRVQFALVLLLLCAALLEIGNAFAGCWARGMVVNVVFLLSFAAMLVWIAKEVPAQYQTAKATVDMKLQLMENRIVIALSQIRPHFLYNALNTIEALCTKDPELAARTVRDFGSYLRGNMDSLTNKSIIPFSDEYQHLQHYLAIEKLRFDNIRVAYDIEASDFALPALTVQPLVENAVKYGVTKRKTGGTITIATCEKPNCYQITVTDDGVGFDAEQAYSSSRTHVGIANVRNRLGQMCGGTLTVESQIGIGTTATILIPKEGKTL